MPAPTKAHQGTRERTSVMRWLGVLEPALLDGAVSGSFTKPGWKVSRAGVSTTLQQRLPRTLEPDWTYDSLGHESKIPTHGIGRTGRVSTSPSRLRTPIISKVSNVAPAVVQCGHLQAHRLPPLASRRAAIPPCTTHLTVPFPGCTLDPVLPKQELQRTPSIPGRARHLRLRTYKVS